jgi:hypothetical protein
MSTVEEAKRLGGYELAKLADCCFPDTLDSPGALFLGSVRDQVIDAWDAGQLSRDATDAIHEIADSAPDVYTYTRWLEFTDLGGWEEEVGWLGDATLTDLAGLALYQIAARLVTALVDQLTYGS